MIDVSVQCIKNTKLNARRRSCNIRIILFYFFPIASEEQEVVDNMKKLLGKVEEMQKQRESLEKQLRDQVHSDDITTSLVVQEGDREVKSFCLPRAVYAFT